MIRITLSQWLPTTLPDGQKTFKAEKTVRLFGIKILVKTLYLPPTLDKDVVATSYLTRL